MNQYTIYCTPEQTKRAYKLGAPIEKCEYNYYVPNDEYSFMIGKKIIHDDEVWYQHLQIPTTEQMCGWLRKEKHFSFNVIDGCYSYKNKSCVWH